MVLCYHLQHPSLYSPEGLDEAKRLLIEFLEHGSYDHPIQWAMTADVVTGGIEGYCDNVRQWAHSIHHLLTATGNDAVV